MTRIIYKKQNNILTNKYPILCNNKFLNVEINLNTLVYHISELTENLISGQGKNSADVKKRVKQYLKDSGVVFKDEIRNKGNTKKL